MARSPHPLEHAQRAYADLMERLVRYCLLLLGVVFLLYLLRLLPTAVPVAQVPGRWHLSLGEYLAAGGAGAGRWCRGCRGAGDYLNFAAIFLLNLVPLVCYLRLVPLLARQGNRFLLLLAIAQSLVLLLVAAGLVTAG